MAPRTASSASREKGRPWEGRPSPGSVGEKGGISLIFLWDGGPGGPAAWSPRRGSLVWFCVRSIDVVEVERVDEILEGLKPLVFPASLGGLRALHVLLGLGGRFGHYCLVDEDRHVDSHGKRQGVGERAGDFHLLKTDGDSLGLEGADPDRKEALRIDLLEDDNAVLRHETHANAID